MVTEITGDVIEKLQCPLCTAVGHLAIAQQCGTCRWEITCRSCAAEIQLPSIYPAQKISQIFAYSIPEKGKEFEDLSRGP